MIVVEELLDIMQMEEIPFVDRFGMLVNIEHSNRKGNSLKHLIRNAGIRAARCVYWKY
ncbi:hypothetical protein AALH30_03500 [Blautia pseudococcoides]|uniref:hypothetical protein n=1 Tax=Blautia pseudococcoides TaxID=1796616 RepID=UPI001FAE0571|nr:hypothetical protein [Blautia pseudococcoides]